MNEIRWLRFQNKATVKFSVPSTKLQRAQLYQIFGARKKNGKSYQLGLFDIGYVLPRRQWVFIYHILKTNNILWIIYIIISGKQRKPNKKKQQGRRFVVQWCEMQGGTGRKMHGGSSSGGTWKFHPLSWMLQETWIWQPGHCLCLCRS